METLLESKAIQWSNDGWEPASVPIRKVWWSIPGFQTEVVDLRTRLVRAPGADYTALTALLRRFDPSANAVALAAFLAPPKATSLSAHWTPIRCSYEQGSTAFGGRYPLQLSVVLNSEIGKHLAEMTFDPATYVTVAARLGTPAVVLRTHVRCRR